MSRKKQDCIFSNGKIEFKIGDFIDGGGNGKVYNVDFITNSIPYPLVVKVFKFGKKQKARYERFANEAKKNSELQKDVAGLVEIIDYNLPESPTQNNPAWYLMKKYRSYDIEAKKSLKDKLLEMKQLAEIINTLAKRGYAHRDIKPKNILVDDNDKMILCDFGLLWHQNDKRLTNQDEKIGPSNILPPELERMDLNSEIDYCYSDVYLFAKVLWMAVKKDSFGFIGQYRISSPGVYLKPEDYDVPTIQPLHELLSKATNDNPAQRITIEQCISYINDQLSVIDEIMNPDRLKSYQYIEKLEATLFESTLDELVFYNEFEIFKAIKSLLNVSCFEFVSKPEGVAAHQFIFDVAKELMDGQIELINSKSGLHYLVCVEKMVKSTKYSKLSIYLKDCMEIPSDYIKYGTKGIAASFGNKYYLDSSCHIELRCKVSVSAT